MGRKKERKRENRSRKERRKCLHKDLTQKMANNTTSLVPKQGTTAKTIISADSYRVSKSIDGDLPLSLSSIS